MARFKRPKSIGSKTRIAKYSRVAGCEDERFRDISVVPDLNNAGAKSSISTNVNILHLVNSEAEVEMEVDHGLRLLSELADQDEFSSLTPTPSLKRIVIKDIDSVMGEPSKKNQRGKAMEISPTPTDDGLLGNFASTGL
ncbi:hypothetical protein AXG93_4368s2050 [Marchantia polymorpha subsp. ruderalis]|uniref:Uncharacterized protein n=1 Tax=Marchantia polymorpha subsp. ruderalis TaxID=1480154 RepID=A0A176VZW6_MARPO|nr:hypothetical protein AXG93_4368s2050 [Marchantia polymorpha subsp. ruderalis]